MGTSTPLAPVAGVRLSLRLIQPEDASYLFGLRSDPEHNRHLSPVSGTSDDQRRWIERYKEREAAGGEYYFVIERRDTGERCGVVRIYQIEDDRFTWGSWILDHHKPPKAALESAMLVYVVGFEILDLAWSSFDVKKQNLHTLRFHDRFGATRVGEDGENIFYRYGCCEFTNDKNRIYDVLYI